MFRILVVIYCDRAASRDATAANAGGSSDCNVGDGVRFRRRERVWWGARLVGGGDGAARLQHSIAIALTHSLSLGLSVNHSLGLSLLSRIITVSRRNRPGNGTHSQHACCTVPYTYARRSFRNKQLPRRALSAVFASRVSFPPRSCCSLSAVACTISRCKVRVRLPVIRRVFVRKSRYSVFCYLAGFRPRKPSEWPTWENPNASAVCYCHSEVLH